MEPNRWKLWMDLQPSISGLNKSTTKGWPQLNKLPPTFSTTPIHQVSLYLRVAQAHLKWRKEQKISTCEIYSDQLKRQHKYYTVQTINTCKKHWFHFKINHPSMNIKLNSPNQHSPHRIFPWKLLFGEWISWVKIEVHRVPTAMPQWNSMTFPWLFHDFSMTFNAFFHDYFTRLKCKIYEKCCNNHHTRTYALTFHVWNWSIQYWNKWNCTCLNFSEWADIKKLKCD